MPNIIDPDLERRVVAFSDELDRLGYSQTSQCAALGALFTAVLGMMPAAERKRHLLAHLAALQTVGEELE